jgi:putative SbcD/Mre11-related phosphoesterase
MSTRPTRERGPAPATRGGLFPGPDGWQLAPEGAAVHPAEGVAVVADVHLGYEWSRGGGGDMVPEHSRGETIARLGRLLDRVDVARLVVAGDLVESPTFCPRTRRDVADLTAWLAARGVALQWLRGNHDGARPGLEPAVEVAGWTVAHGDRPLAVERLMTGHVHPVLRAGGTTAPCFLIGPTRIVLPAFTANAAGWNVAGTTAPEHLGDLAALRCIASAGAELLDFGSLGELPARLARGVGGTSCRRISIPPSRAGRTS